MGAIDLDEIERRIPSPATECAYCYRLGTMRCLACGALVCEDHRILAARDAIGTECEGVAMVPAHHDTATMDRVALVAEVRRLREGNAERASATPPWPEWARRFQMERDEARAEAARLRAELATAREIADIADDVRVSQIKELYDVIDGSPDEPTDNELAAHAGAWLARLYNGAYATMTETAARNVRGVMVRGGPYAVRWWALDPSERFCPRPVVTTVAATLDAGPRDADGREVTP